MNKERDLEFYILFLFASWTGLFQVFSLLNVSFLNLCYVFSTILIITSTFYLKQRNNFKVSFKRFFITNKFIIFLSLAWLFYTGHLIKENYDDVIYASRAVYYLDNPSQPLELKYFNYALLPFEIEIKNLLASSYEFIFSYISLITNLNFLVLYNNLPTFLFSLLFPIYSYKVFYYFLQNKKDSLSCSLILFLYFIFEVGGNSSLAANIFMLRQGKMFLVGLCTFILIKLTTSFWEEKSYSNWLKLLFANIAFSGLSTTALLYVPLFYLFWGLSFFILSNDNTKKRINYLMIYGLSCVNYILINIYLLINTNSKHFRVLGYDGWPDSFYEQFVKNYGEGLSFKLFLFLFSFIYIYIVSKFRKKLKLLFCVSILLFSSLLFPPFYAFVSKFIPYVIFKRFFNLVPEYIIVSIALFFLIRLLNMKKKYFFGTISIILATIVIFHEGLIFKNKSLKPFSLLKIKKDNQLKIKYFLNYLKPGPTISPSPYRVYLPLFSSFLTQHYVRGHYLQVSASISEKLSLYEQRKSVQEYLYSKKANKDILSCDEWSDGYVNIIIFKNHNDYEDINKCLVTKGFGKKTEFRNEVLYTK